MNVKSDDKDDDMKRYYGEDAVTAIITVKVDTKDADVIASKLAKFPDIVECYLVTGDTDILAKARFKGYAEFKEFVMNNIQTLKSVKETRTSLVVTTYKEGKR